MFVSLSLTVTDPVQLQQIQRARNETVRIAMSAAESIANYHNTFGHLYGTEPDELYCKPALFYQSSEMLSSYVGVAIMLVIALYAR